MKIKVLNGSPHHNGTITAMAKAFFEAACKAEGMPREFKLGICNRLLAGKHVLSALMAAAIVFAACCLVACGSQQQSESGIESSNAAGAAETKAVDGSEGEASRMANSTTSAEARTASALTITVGDKTFTVTLADNQAAAALVAKAPVHVSFAELNGNEKYAYLNISLPTDAQVPANIEAGDVMLYGDDCLVVFYESHSTTYSYTRIGTLDQAPSQFADAVGMGADAVIDLAD